MDQLGQRLQRGCAFLSGAVVAVTMLAPATTHAATNDADRPLSGKTSGQTTFSLLTPSESSSDATGEVSHLGSTFQQNEITSFVLTGPNSFTDTAITTLVAANGDRLIVHFSGSGTFTGISVGSTTQQSGVDTITGGTGRFANATGTLTASQRSLITSATATTTTSEDDYSFQGSISY